MSTPQSRIRTVDDMDDADLYEFLRDRGLTHDQAVGGVEGRRIQAAPPVDAEPDVDSMSDADLYEFLRNKEQTHEQAVSIVQLRQQEAQEKAAAVSAGGAGGSFGADPNDPREAGRSAAATETGVRGVISPALQGAGSAAFGVGTPITAVGEYIGSRIEGKPRSFRESLEFARGYREGSVEDNPAAYGTGFVGGLYGSGKAVTTAITKAPAVVKSVFTLQSGQTKRNIARLAATGAAAAGATAGMQEGTEAVLPAAGAGAVLGPVIAGAARGVVGVGRAVMSKINPDNAAIRILSKRLGESADAIAARYNEFTQTMGRKPRLVEIMRRETAEEMGQVSASKVGVEAGRVFREAGEEAAASRPAELRAKVERGGYTTTAPALTRARDKAFKHTMSQIGEHRAPLSNEIKDVIEDAEVQGALPPILRRRINQAIEEGEELGSIELTVNEFDMMRQAINKKIGAGAGQLYKDYRDKLRGYIVDHVPEYGAALQKYGRYSDAIKGAKLGRSVMTGSADEFKDAVAKASEGTSDATGSGVRGGARSKLANTIGDSPAKAVTTAAQLAENPGLRDRLVVALGGAEAIQLQRVGEISTRAARNLAAAAPRSTAAQARTQAQAQEIQEAITGGVILAGRSSGALRANFLNNIQQRFRMSKAAAKRMAEMAVDPNKAHIFIQRVKAAGVADAELLKWYRDAAQAAGISVGSTVNGQ